MNFPVEKSSIFIVQTLIYLFHCKTFSLKARETNSGSNLIFHLLFAFQSFGCLLDLWFFSLQFHSIKVRNSNTNADCATTGWEILYFMQKTGVFFLQNSTVCEIELFWWINWFREEESFNFRSSEPKLLFPIYQTWLSFQKKIEILKNPQIEGMWYSYDVAPLINSANNIIQIKWNLWKILTKEMVYIFLNSRESWKQDLQI